MAGNGSALSSAAKKKSGGPRFIQGAIKRPGQLHRDLGVPQGQKIPPGKMAEARSGKLGKKVQQRANFAKLLGSFH